jgi:SAM-dependent methyltransferase
MMRTRPKLRGSAATGSFAMVEPRLATAAAIAVRVGRFALTPWREDQVRRRLLADPTLLGYRCNLCNRSNAAPASTLGRESPSCWYCESTVRVRSIVDILAVRLLGQSLPLSRFPIRKDLTGIGLSDSHHYANGLKRAFRYRNTFLHRSPRLDLVDVPRALDGTLDFLVASEVLEHVRPPVSDAFAGARRLLKPGGMMVITTPYDSTPGARTVEHYPRLHNFQVLPKAGGLVLVNRTADGDVEKFEDPPMHGGQGLVLEMRVFSLDDLRGQLMAAGFREIEFWERESSDFGIIWQERHSRPLVAIA